MRQDVLVMLVLFGFLGASIAAIILVIYKTLEAWKTQRFVSRAMARHNSQKCVFCGYDLRGSQDRCSECGWSMLRPIDDQEQFHRLDLARMQDEWPTAHVAPAPGDVGDKSVLIYSTKDVKIAKLLLEQLNARGVYARYQRMEYEELIGRSIQRKVQFRLTVPTSEYDKAQGILNRFAVNDQGREAKHDHGDLPDGLAQMSDCKVRAQDPI